MKSEKGFTIRVYGILITTDLQILVTEEMYRGMFMRKFPGGGLQWGEGLHVALKREIMEETGMEVAIGRHWYTSSDCIISAFDPQLQVMAVYYEIKPTSVLQFPQGELNTQLDKTESFRLVPLSMLADADFFTFTNDQQMGRLLYDHFHNASTSAVE
jgi:ADP-ribose pyrophosphatase YjhB (NUDIX family)